ncbi:hypothetical protein RCZ04_23620 [Capnocytophaga sp. HP1101]
MTLVVFVGCKKRIIAPTDIELNQLHGKVKQMTERIYYQGNVDRVYFEEEAKAADSILYVFDEKGRNTEVVRLNEPSDDDDESEQVFKSMYVTHTDNEVSSTVYDSQGNVMYRSKIELTPEGLALTRTDIDEIKKERIVVNYTYEHSKGKAELKSVTYNENGTRNENAILTYNKKGRIAKGLYYEKGEEKPHLTTTDTYNNRGYIEKEEYIYHSYSDSSTYTITTTYEYEYDAQGSATVVKEYENGELKKTTKRIIEYY